MHTVAYVFRRVPGMSLADFKDHYENVHGPLMVDILKDRGLVSYNHYPVRAHGLGDEYVPEDGPAYDAISIYQFQTAQQASDAWPIEALKEDSEKFIDFDTMVMMPLEHRQVFPVLTVGDGS